MATAALVTYAEAVKFTGPTVNLTIPTDVRVGDQMILLITRGPTGSNATSRIGVMTAGSGWQEMNSSITGSGTTQLAFIIYQKIATAGDPGSVVSVGNVDPTGIVQSAILTAWTGPIVRFSPSIGGAGSGGTISGSGPSPASGQTVGNRSLIMGAARSNASNGQVGFFQNAGYSNVPVAGYYSRGVAQSIQTFVHYGTVPAAKPSVYSVTATATLNSRVIYVVELGPGATYARPMAARAGV